MSLYFKAKIVNSDPLTIGDDNDIVEQVIVVELPNGLRFGILDGFVTQIEPEMVGNTKEISLIVPVEKKTYIIPERKAGIEPSSENPLDYHYHKFFGRVIETGVKDIWYNEPGLQHLICVDAGFAYIMVNLHEEIFQIVKVGDFVEIVASMTTLLRIR